VTIVTLFFWRAPVVDADLLVRVVELPRLALVLLIEVDDEERVLEVNEEVAHIGHFLGLLLVRNNFQR